MQVVIIINYYYYIKFKIDSEQSFFSKTVGIEGNLKESQSFENDMLIKRRKQWENHSNMPYEIHKMFTLPE